MFNVSKTTSLSLQKSFHQRLINDKKSEVFFTVIFDHIRKAEQEIKATGPVNTAEAAGGTGKTVEEHKEAGKEEIKKKGDSLLRLCWRVEAMSCISLFVFLYALMSLTCFVH